MDDFDFDYDDYDFDFLYEKPKRRGHIVWSILRTVLLLIIAGTLIVGVFSLVSTFGDVTGFTRKVRNPENLINFEHYGFRDGQEIKGITFNVDKDGVITLNGQVTEDFSVGIDTVTLSNKDYNFSVVADNPLNYKSVFNLAGTDSSLIKNLSFAENFTIRPTAPKQVRIMLALKAGDSFKDYKIAPVCVPGTNIGEYFIEDHVIL